MERRLAAIFSTDVQGYSRLMGEDEVATVHTITAYWSESWPPVADRSAQRLKPRRCLYSAKTFSPRLRRTAIL